MDTSFRRVMREKRRLSWLFFKTGHFSASIEALSDESLLEEVFLCAIHATSAEVVGEILANYGSPGWCRTFLRTLRTTGRGISPGVATRLWGYHKEARASQVCPRH